MKLLNRLQQDIAELSLDISITQQEKLIAYVNLLHKWNQAYNLTAVRDPLEMVSRHISDSLAILPWLPKTGAVLDVGTGAGLPGLVLAITKPEQAFTLLDSNTKRMTFLHKVLRELTIDNVTLAHHRVEAYQPPQPFNTIVSRAFSSLEDFVKLTTHLADSDTLYLAMKGKYPEAELTALTNKIQLQDSVVLTVPNTDAERHLIMFTAPSSCSNCSLD
jgi:16S rRNA (guanine527-N7)-methyltransferase